MIDVDDDMFQNVSTLFAVTVKWSQRATHALDVRVYHNVPDVDDIYPRTAFTTNVCVCHVPTRNRNFTYVP